MIAVNELKRLIESDGNKNMCREALICFSADRYCSYSQDLNKIEANKLASIVKKSINELGVKDCESEITVVETYPLLFKVVVKYNSAGITFGKLLRAVNQIKNLKTCNEIKDDIWSLEDEVGREIPFNPEKTKWFNEHKKLNTRAFRFVKKIIKNMEF